ncbi:MAG TPA: glycoside hydrolase family 57 protein [Polyangiales bacterium]|nr:glycoside hydrolase family 57 protein [Polyangiales bacterium]
MPAVCLYFEVHQPYRVRPYDVFQVGRSHDYFDEKLNREVLQKVARKCYLPANAAMLRLIQQSEGRFRVAYSLTGVALEQMKAYAPEVIESFQALVATGCVELLSETYYHSLASLYTARPEPGASSGDPLEFRAQVTQHTRLMEELFGVTPRVFCNTELIYDDHIGRELAALGYKGVLAEGADDILDWRSPNHVYRAPGSELGLLLKNYKLSDDVAFRFSNRAWSEFPLSADKYAGWLHALDGKADTINLFMDYETFGEHQWAETGIFGFLQRLPAAVLAAPDFSFLTPSEVLANIAPISELSFPRTVSWADSERDLSAWTGNDMQTRALNRIYALGERIKRRNNPALLGLWRKLTSSDHFYYMCTKWFADGDVHAYFSPYESPYEAFINYMNAVSDLEEFVLGKPAASRAEAVLPAAE